MSGRQSGATERAVKMVQKQGKGSILKAALKYGVAVSTVYRGLRRLEQLEVQPTKV